MKFNGTAISEFPRGDDDALLVGLTGGKAFETGDKVYFCLRATKETTLDIVQIESTTFVPYTPTGATEPVDNAGCLINILHSATINVPLGSYYYTVWVMWSDGTITTLVDPDKFKLTPGGSHE